MGQLFCRVFVAGFVQMILGFNCAYAAAAAYTLTGLGTLGGTRTQSGANSINESGQIAGTSYSTSGSDDGHAFIWQSGVMTDLGTLGGAWSTGECINASGQVTGAGTTANDFRDHGFLYSAGQMTDIGMLGNSNADPRAINDSSQIVGESGLPNFGPQHAFLYENGQMTDLGTLGGDTSDAFDINSGGQVAGYSAVGTAQHAYRYQRGIMTDLGTLGGWNSAAWAIANNGDVVGQSDTGDGALHAFLHHNGVMTDLGSLGGTISFALGVNDNGQVVGRSTINGSAQPYHAFLYQNGVMSDLNSMIAPGSGWTLLGAGDINEAGWIVGFGTDPVGRYEGFLLTPVPEPVSMSAVGLGVTFIMMCRRPCRELVR